MQRIYLGLILLLVAFVAMTEVGTDVGAFQRYGPNLAAEIVSVILTLAFVQAILTRQERSRQLRAAIPTLRASRDALASLVDTWSIVLKGCLRQGASRPETLDELFPSYVTERLMELDLESRIGPDHEPCGDWVVRRLERGRARLRDAVQGRLASVDVAFEELLDALLHDPFLDLIHELIRDDDTDTRTWRVRLHVSGGHREAFFERLLKAVSIQNDLATEVGGIRSRHSAPRHSLTGLEMGQDYDLRVTTSLEEPWWRAAPAPGSLVGGRQRLAPSKDARS